MSTGVTLANALSTGVTLANALSTGVTLPNALSTMFVYLKQLQLLLAEKMIREMFCFLK